MTRGVRPIKKNLAHEFFFPRGQVPKGSQSGIMKTKREKSEAFQGVGGGVRKPVFGTTGKRKGEKKTKGSRGGAHLMDTQKSEAQPIDLGGGTYN